MRPIPEELVTGPFTREQALALGVTPRMLNGRRFQRIYPTVWCHRDHKMTFPDRVEAGRLALPAGSHVTGLSRLRLLGLDYGPIVPVRFVREGDLHLAFADLFLHRTVKLPPVDDVGVTPVAAFVSYCRWARVIDAIKVGDWLIRAGHLHVPDLVAFTSAEDWRDGAHEAAWIAEHLTGDSRSLMESETRAVLSFAGLPDPEPNLGLPLADDVTIIGDLVYRRWRTVVEYEGEHHQRDRDQYLRDLDRYAIMRRYDVGYVQVTRERLRHAKTLVGEVYRELLQRGYDGPPPHFGDRWRLLFQPLHAVVPRRRGRRTPRAVA